MDSLVSVDWLKENINDPALIMLYTNLRPSPQDLEGLRIPHSRLFDLKNTFKDLSNPLPNSFPFPDQFQEACISLGIDNTSKIVIIDPEGIYSSPRAWYLFKAMGAKNVGVLDGGLPAWKESGGQLEPIHPGEEYSEGDFMVQFQKDSIVKIQEVEINPQNGFQVIDARSKGRFEGVAPEPRKGLRSGSIPGSINLPYTEVLRNGFFKPKKELQKLFTGLDLQNKKIVFSCGSGITACIILLAYHQISNEKTFLYDGSWTEWATKYSVDSNN